MAKLNKRWFYTYCTIGISLFSLLGSISIFPIEISLEKFPKSSEEILIYLAISYFMVSVMTAIMYFNPSKTALFLLVISIIFSLTFRIAIAENTVGIVMGFLAFPAFVVYSYAINFSDRLSVYLYLISIKMKIKSIEIIYSSKTVRILSTILKNTDNRIGKFFDMIEEDVIKDPEPYSVMFKKLIHGIKSEAKKIPDEGWLYLNATVWSVGFLSVLGYSPDSNFFDITVGYWEKLSKDSWEFISTLLEIKVPLVVRDLFSLQIIFCGICIRANFIMKRSPDFFKLNTIEYQKRYVAYIWFLLITSFWVFMVVKQLTSEIFFSYLTPHLDIKDAISFGFFTVFGALVFWCLSFLLLIPYYYIFYNSKVSKYLRQSLLSNPLKLIFINLIIISIYIVLYNLIFILKGYELEYINERGTDIFNILFIVIFIYYCHLVLTIIVASFALLRVPFSLVLIILSVLLLDYLMSLSGL